MKVIIIEDELPAQAKLESMLSKLTDVTLLARLGSVKESIEWLENHSSPDLAFVDIQLSDDHSFEIFRKTKISFPVIFTTAYDKYLLESLEFNSIDYLLKPVTEEKLKRALDKVKTLEQHFVLGNFQKLMVFISGQAKTKERLLAKKGMEFVTIPIDEVAYIFTDHKVTFLRDTSGRQFILDKPLGELETDLDPSRFFRINRKYITSIHAIERFKPDNGKIKIILKPEVKEEVHVSKETAPAFRTWIGVS
jgi:DNA-binding LytR/AlgR family response regulator